ncbi:MAG: membrane integrity-associated transporter subunit PqiC [Hyphomicrobiaceae bacterium]|nr:membrane integrity-associated transporter subunit PqiC [Hyphomicrobiaceae bacterium]
MRFRSSLTSSFLALALAGGTLSGCAGGGSSSATIYDLTAPRQVEASGSTRRQLLVPSPIAVRAYASDRIVVRTGDATLAYFPDAQWSDDLPALLQARLVETFEASGRVRAVGRPGQGLLIDVQVVTEIRAFEIAVTDQGAVADVVLSVKLMNDANGRVIAARVFDALVPAANDGADAGAQALDAALDQVMSDIVRWALQTI